MLRREFIAGLGSAAALPVVVRAQQPGMPVTQFRERWNAFFYLRTSKAWRRLGMPWAAT